MEPMNTKPGNGFTSPFGNGQGATQEEGPSTGGHNFMKDPTSNVPAGVGRNFAAGDDGNRPQQDVDERPNPASIPPGGTLPFSSPPRPVTQTPFKLKGE